MRPQWLRAPETRRLKAAIDWHLRNVPDDRLLRERLEGMATAAHFKALWWYWAPRLYERNRVLFRPFIQHWYAEHFVSPAGGPSHRIAWRGEVAATLDPWLRRLEGENEVQLFRRLYAWKHRAGKGWGIDVQQWRKDVRERFATSSPGARLRVLQRYDLPGALDELTALCLYEADPVAARPFIVRHLPNPWRSSQMGPEHWQRLAARAHELQDESFHDRLYQLQVPLEVWIKDALKLCGDIEGRDELCAALEKRHPRNRRGISLGPHFHRLLEARGLDVAPYVRRHLRDVHAWRRGAGYENLVSLTRSRGWIELWIAIVVTCGNTQHYNAAIREVLNDWGLEEPERMRRLTLFSGLCGGRNGMRFRLARLPQLSSATALELHERYPQLLSQAFKVHITPSWRESYIELFEIAWAAGDEDLADFLASRYVTDRIVGPRSGGAPSDIAAEKYAALKLDPPALARRAASVLTRIPGHSIRSYDPLIRENRLARLLFERSLRSFLTVPDAVRDLLECGEIHVQHLAYRVLGLPDPRAVALAHDNLDLLLGTLLGLLHRGARLAAFAALANAASHVDDARRILARAREALVWPDARYPKEQLVGLIGRILARHPELAEPAERPVIYQRTARA